MDKETEIKQYKKIGREKEYMREYMRKRYHERKGVNKIVKPVVHDGEIMEKTEHGISKGTFGDMIEMTKTVLGKDDPVAQAIDKYAKFVPLVAEFARGYIENMKSHQAQAQQMNRVQPPPGWVESTEMQKLSKKYDASGNITAWYQAGMYYDNVVASGQQAVSYAPVMMQDTVHGNLEGERREAAMRMQEKKMTMQELQRRSMDFDKATPANDVPVVARQDGQPSNIKEAMEKNKKVQESEESMTAEDTLEHVSAQMREDNERYLTIVKNYFNNRKIDDFEKDLENIDQTIEKFKMTFLPLLPLQARGMIKSISYEELEKELKLSDPLKYETLQKKKLSPKLAKMWQDIQSTM